MSRLLIVWDSQPQLKIEVYLLFLFLASTTILSKCMDRNVEVLTGLVEKIIMFL